MKKLAALFVITIASLLGQDGLPVNVSAGPTDAAYTKLPYFSGSNMIYLCVARAQQPTASVITVTAATNANPVVFTATAHGMGDVASTVTMTPAIQIAGLTGAWGTALNGVWIATPITANTFSVAVDSTALGAFPSTGKFTTKAPLWNQPVWSITSYLYYAGTSNLSFVGNPTNPGGAGSVNLVGGSTGPGFKCSQRASLGYQ